MLFPDEQHPSAIGGFEVLERLGSGGAGKVYLARSKGGRLVAVKVLSDNARADPEESATLAREASLCVRLSHPAIVQVRALVQEEGVSALVFDYVEGVALGRLLRFLSGRGERLSDLAAWHIVERILAALDYAHQQTPPIVHRDVTPGNVLLDWAGDAKLTDFGMAKMLGVASNTQLGLVKGTLGCMAPEQARGDPVTERADVYAAALLAWRLATGFAPFGKYRNDEVEMLRAMKNPRLPPLAALRPDLPATLTDAVARALEPDPQVRSITAEEFRRAVSTNMNTEPGREDLAVVLAAVREDLARPTPMGGFNIEGDHGSSTGNKGGVPAKEVTSRYSEVAVERDGESGEGAAEPVALKPFSPDFSPEKLGPITGIAPAAVVQEALRREDEPGPRRSFPSLSAQAASQATVSRLSLSDIGNVRTRRRRARSQVILTLVFVAFIFFVVGFALGLAMHR
ncbi:serine/threonine protein kinase [Pendulispora brunnea]|uniref:non-specific serine/threonine protein kinase n=1 Tax=Pendulispora brunnea TaxID=2905690 RepID=A0ABZ2KLE8_9BACT